MKRLYLIITIKFISSCLFGQVLETSSQEKKAEDEEIKTIFSKDHSNGAYFDIYMNYTQISKNNAFEIGSRLAFIIGQSFAIGIDGTGFITDISVESNGDESIMTGGHGGILLEPIIMPKEPVHISIPVLLGGGALVYATTDYENNVNYMEVDYVDGYLLGRPGIEIEFNITRYFRFCINAHYRFTLIVGSENENRVGISSGDLNNFSYGISFKIGKF